jgi:hypothetical protein
MMRNYTCQVADFSYPDCVLINVAYLTVTMFGWKFQKL